MTGAGQFSGVPVEDADEWNGYVPVPSIDIEKWIDEGVSPEYDATGALLNDGFKGDYDKAPGKQLTADKSETIRFTVSNDGEEPLVDIKVSDELTSGTGKISDLVCTFVPVSYTHLTATFDGDNEEDASVYLGGTILGPGAGEAFGKRGDLGTVNLPAGTTGDLDPAIDINYTFRANLSQWDRHSDNFKLDDNVVITDNLLSQASWNLSGNLPVSDLYDNSGNETTSIANAGTCPATAAAFGSDAYVGKYCLDGNKLMILSLIHI